MLLLIDNYDSFTYNLYQYLCELGADVEVHRNDRISLSEIEAMGPERIVISPGPCTPREAGVSVDIVRTFGPSTPLLGVCLGHQCIGEATAAWWTKRGRSSTARPAVSRIQARACSPVCPTPSRPFATTPWSS